MGSNRSKEYFLLTIVSKINVVHDLLTLRFGDVEKVTCSTAGGVLFHKRAFQGMPCPLVLVNKDILAAERLLSSRKRIFSLI